MIFFISEPIFNFFAALFTTFGLQKDDMVIFFLLFQKSEILKNAVSSDGVQRVVWVLKKMMIKVCFHYMGKTVI